MIFSHKCKYLNPHITSHYTLEKKGPRIQEKIGYETVQNFIELVTPKS